MKTLVAALALLTAACSGRADLSSTLGRDAGEGHPSASGGAASGGDGGTGTGGSRAPGSVGKDSGAALASGAGGGGGDASSGSGRTIAGDGGAKSGMGATRDGGDASSGTGGTIAGDGGAAGSGGAATGAGGLGSSAGGTTTGAGGASGGAGGATVNSDSGVPVDVWSLCHDNLRDGNESDIDCGGSCKPCAFAQTCLSDRDCSKTAPGCNANLGGCTCDLVTGTCAASHCADERKDFTEGDVDCGGECARCDLGQHCNVDYDCSWTSQGCGPSGCSCDSLTGVCITNHCIDHHQDSNESDVDCGGGAPCDRCLLGAKCYGEYDCASRACDGITRRCVSDGCTNHVVDGDETDTDCGGGTCGACGSGQWCKVNSDCLGKSCSPTNPHICQ